MRRILDKSSTLFCGDTTLLLYHACPPVKSHRPRVCVVLLPDPKKATLTTDLCDACKIFLVFLGFLDCRSACCVSFWMLNYRQIYLQDNNNAQLFATPIAHAPSVRNLGGNHEKLAIPFKQRRAGLCHNSLKHIVYLCTSIRQHVCVR